jgi:hypothetical protein
VVNNSCRSCGVDLDSSSTVCVRCFAGHAVDCPQCKAKGRLRRKFWKGALGCVRCRNRRQVFVTWSAARAA